MSGLDNLVSRSKSKSASAIKPKVYVDDTPPRSIETAPDEDAGVVEETDRSCGSDEEVDAQQPPKKKSKKKKRPKNEESDDDSFEEKIQKKKKNIKKPKTD